MDATLTDLLNTLDVTDESLRYSISVRLEMAYRMGRVDGITECCRDFKTALHLDQQPVADA